jgi:formylglycine-generating enzyme required for sulfatase activity
MIKFSFLVGAGLAAGMIAAPSGVPSAVAQGSQTLAARSAVQDTKPTAVGEPYIETIAGTVVAFEMVPIPAGRVELDGPQGRVTVPVPPFWMAKTETTWDLFDVWLFGLDEGGQVSAGKDEDAVSRPSKPYILPGANFGRQGRPALAVTHHAAARFAEWLSEKTGRRYRLPTEAEWEHACRAGAADPVADVGRHGWFWENSDDMTQPVATLKPNGFGVHDLLGNVAEWVEGIDGEPVIKGGAFTDDAEDLRCSSRRKQTPAWNATDPQLPKSQWWLADAPFVGFRLIREP